MYTKMPDQSSGIFYIGLNLTLNVILNTHGFS
ncbi:hypothetical protein F941_03066 [Acinetobacter bouvetii DSM 14964 = CIP 107468]|uniref:Uncharacterized protein n=1 Tax=Acinetobacter bouvetii DSM 14964 = CIP 107468 TaxID=1120925 RepID=N9DM43_9GAMM|nr:hypothetical protein F941_03066 [Acinetobacter bouvetii DSM 14964 = CIP 107468]